MRGLIRVYDRLIVTLALLASVMVACVFVTIVADVILRSSGLQPLRFASALSEYALIYITMAAAPWLVRERDHVRIDSFLSYLPKPAQRAVERLLILTCIVLCLVAAYFAARFAIEFWQKGVIDIRSIEIPRAFLFVPLVIGFSLCAIEFARILIIGETLTPAEDKDTTPFEGEI